MAKKFKKLQCPQCGSVSLKQLPITDLVMKYMCKDCGYLLKKSIIELMDWDDKDKK